MTLGVELAAKTCDMRLGVDGRRHVCRIQLGHLVSFGTQTQVARNELTELFLAH